MAVTEAYLAARAFPDGELLDNDWEAFLDGFDVGDTCVGPMEGYCQSSQICITTNKTLHVNMYTRCSVPCRTLNHANQPSRSDVMVSPSQIRTHSTTTATNRLSVVVLSIIEVEHVHAPLRCSRRVERLEDDVCHSLGDFGVAGGDGSVFGGVDDTVVWDPELDGDHDTRVQRHL